MTGLSSTTPDPYEELLVSPRYLAGVGESGDASFAPIAHWPHHNLGDAPCQLLVTSPDHRIRVGWFGDDFELWKITASEDALAAPRWTATANHLTPPEIVAGLTAALAHDYAESSPFESDVRFLNRPSPYWADAVQPLIDAGWERGGGAERGTIEIIAPDKQAGVVIDNRLHGGDDQTVELWSGPPGWGTRAEILFTARTPSHLVAATAAAMADQAPVKRERHQFDHDLAHLVTLAPVRPTGIARPDPGLPRAPTPLDVRRTSVTQAVHRAAGFPRTAADLRVMAARSRTTSGAQNGSTASAPPRSSSPAVSASSTRRSR
ncbi:DUF317 domain-containing protein [Streptomyces sp. NBC_01335]|uniref:DUF317 domain-containing protein n=1 Tax=Streptomyces sp. NBC_01335 TaxID=2903828 RepID=UPI002E12577A|nr:DUF317 domain-containing protein [Streptomyces sp. NBC_01335]